MRDHTKHRAFELSDELAVLIYQVIRYLKRIVLSFGCLWILLGLTAGDTEAGNIREKVKERLREKMEEKSFQNSPYSLIEGKFSSCIQSQYGSGDYRRYLTFDGRKRFYDLHINGCPKEHKKETRTGKAICTIYAPGREDSEVILWTLEDGGHTWPGGKSSLPESQVGKVNMDISVSELMWQFFERHSKQGVGISHE
ncbi:MAG: hypothetical protein V1749_01010 [Candidatus Desantisbacteria bacterium]